jgi:hypothetical protein
MYEVNQTSSIEYFPNVLLEGPDIYLLSHHATIAPFVHLTLKCNEMKTFHLFHKLCKYQKWHAEEDICHFQNIIPFIGTCAGNRS